MSLPKKNQIVCAHYDFETKTCKFCINCPCDDEYGGGCIAYYPGEGL